MKTIGVISDTHGLLRWEAEAALARVDHIIHAGDIGTPEILERLQRIAPVTAVRGNNDKGEWANPLPARASCCASWAYCSASERSSSEYLS